MKTSKSVEVLSKDILLLVAKYYYHWYKNQSMYCPTCGQKLSRIPETLIDFQWDKPADLDAINSAAKKDGWQFEASAGTFWFTKNKSGYLLEMTINHNNYLDGGERTFGMGKK